MMMVELTTVPSVTLPLVDLAEHLRLSHGFADQGDQDAALERCLRAGLAAVEARIGKAVFARRFLVTLTEWQNRERHNLPLAPVSSVDSVTLVDVSAMRTVVDPGSYVLMPDAHAPAIRATGGSLRAPAMGGTIEIELTAGYSADWAGVPADLKQAVLLLAGANWDQDVAPETGIPISVSILLEPYRSLRLGGATT